MCTHAYIPINIYMGLLLWGLQLRELEGVLRHREDLIRSLEGAVAQRDSALSFVLKEKFHLSKAIVASRAAACQSSAGESCSSSNCSNSSSNGSSSTSQPKAPSKPGGVSFALPAATMLVHEHDAFPASSEGCSSNSEQTRECGDDACESNKEAATGELSSTSTDGEVRALQQAGNASLEELKTQKREPQLAAPSESDEGKQTNTSVRTEGSLQAANLHANPSAADEGDSIRGDRQKPSFGESELKVSASNTDEKEFNGMQTKEAAAHLVTEGKGDLHCCREMKPPVHSKALLADAAAYLGSNGWRLSKNCLVKLKDNGGLSSTADAEGFPSTCGSFDEEAHGLSEQHGSEKASAGGGEKREATFFCEEVKNGGEEGENAASILQPIDARDTQSGSKVSTAAVTASAALQGLCRQQFLLSIRQKDSTL